MKQHGDSLRLDCGWETTFETVAWQVAVDWRETALLTEVRVLLKGTLLTTKSHFCLGTELIPVSRYAAVSLRLVMQATFLLGQLPREFESWAENENAKLLRHYYLEKEYDRLDGIGDFRCESAIDGSGEYLGVELHFWRTACLDLTYIGRNLLEMTLVRRAGLWFR